MATKKTKSVAKNKPVKKESYFAHRPYFTIAVLAALVCALAFMVELINNALTEEAVMSMGTGLLR